MSTKFLMEVWLLWFKQKMLLSYLQEKSSLGRCSWELDGHCCNMVWSHCLGHATWAELFSQLWQDKKLQLGYMKKSVQKPRMFGKDIQNPYFPLWLSTSYHSHGSTNTLKIVERLNSGISDIVLLKMLPEKCIAKHFHEIGRNSLCAHMVLVEDIFKD